MNKADYRANWWNTDIFSLQDSPRSIGGYSIQQCEVEVVLDKAAMPDDISLTLSFGARIYANNDAQTFFTTSEKTVEWWRSQMTWTPELEIPATYDVATQQVQAEPEKTYELDITDALADRIAEAGLDGSSAETGGTTPSALR